MEIDRNSQSIILESRAHYAVVLSALTHGLSLARFNPEVHDHLKDQGVANAREIRNGMLSVSKPELPFVLPYDAAKTAVAGIRSANFGSTRETTQTFKVKIVRKRIGAELKCAFLDLNNDTV